MTLEEMIKDAGLEPKTIKKIGLAEGKCEPIDVDIEYLERA